MKRWFNTWLQKISLNVLQSFAFVPAVFWKFDWANSFCEINEDGHDLSLLLCYLFVCLFIFVGGFPSFFFTNWHLGHPHKNATTWALPSNPFLIKCNHFSFSVQPLSCYTVFFWLDIILAMITYSSKTCKSW